MKLWISTINPLEHTYSFWAQQGEPFWFVEKLPNMNQIKKIGKHFALAKPKSNFRAEFEIKNIFQ